MDRMQTLPQVKLDMTLAELYAQGRAKDHDGRIAMVLCAPNSELAPTSKMTRNTKYLYQDPIFNMTSDATTSQERQKIKETVAVTYLSLIPQRDAFMAGDMPLILFDIDDLEEKAARGREEIIKTIKTLELHQKPELVFCSGPDQLDMEANKIDLLVVKAEVDGIQGFPLALDLDTLYFLNSKAALCTSGLPSPKSILLELGDFSAEPESCCITCTRRKWLDGQIARIMDQISSQKLPFVLKNQQTYAGGGTWTVSSPKDLLELKQTLYTTTLPKLLSQVDASNSHLDPATLIISEMITEARGDWGLTFFITGVGKCIFLALTQQMTSSSHSWIGSIIDYTAQSSYEKKSTPIMEEIGAWLYKYGYYGPCGADILETTDGKDLETTILQIVDLNVRTSASHVLGLMKGHFSQRRGLHNASLLDLTVQMTRQAFIHKLQDHFREGRIVIVSWYENEESGVSSGNIVIGGHDTSELEHLIGLVKELEKKH